MSRLTSQCRTSSFSELSCRPAAAAATAPSSDDRLCPRALSDRERICCERRRCELLPSLGLPATATNDDEHTPVAPPFIARLN